jgi:hypothetical protein
MAFTATAPLVGAGAPRFNPPIRSRFCTWCCGAPEASRPTRRPTAPAMPSFGCTLTDFEVVPVSIYVRNAWGNRAPQVDSATVSKTRLALEQRAD